MNNKKGDIPITVFAIGVLSVCIFALVVFYETIPKSTVVLGGLKAVEELNSKIEKNYVLNKGASSGFSELGEGNIFSAIQYASNSGTINGRSCECTNEEDCNKYAQAILKYSQEESIDPVLFLSIIMQESDCVLDTCSCSVAKVNGECPSGKEIACGITQISLDNCGKYEGLSDRKDDCINELRSNYEIDIQVGLDILKEKGKFKSCSQDTDCKHPMGSNLFCNGKTCVARCNNEEFCEYEFDGCSDLNRFYSGWDAAVRGYNGWGCNKNFVAQDNYVEDVNERYAQLFTSSKNSNLATVNSKLGILSLGKRFYFSVKSFE